LSAAIVLDAAQRAVAQKFDALAEALRHWHPRRFRFFTHGTAAPRGIYLWGAVGRGKTMLMDGFFDAAPVAAKRRVHFNAFMVETHARLHEFRQRATGDDPIPARARAIAARARLLCFDEFQVRDVADAMILGRLFEQLVARDVLIVATSNDPPDRLYEGGLNRQLFLPFVAMIEERLDVIELQGDRDYRLGRMAVRYLYVTPLGPEADRLMDEAWAHLTDGARGEPEILTVLGRRLDVPRAARGAARFSFDALCRQPLAAADYLALARRYHVLMIENIPLFGSQTLNEARRFTVLIDMLYDEGVKLVCSAAAPLDRLYDGDRDAFRRTASRLAEMQGPAWLECAHRPRASEAPPCDPVFAA
jgi:cell division protein ZapE